MTFLKEIYYTIKEEPRKMLKLIYIIPGVGLMIIFDLLSRLFLVAHELCWGAHVKTESILEKWSKEESE